MAAPSVSEVDICNFAFEGRLELVRASLDKSSELINKTDSSRRSALHWACSGGRNDVVRLLLSKGAQVSACIVQL
jgi:26S proteasome non-ATPase regulatory subunit 10